MRYIWPMAGETDESFAEQFQSSVAQRAAAIDELSQPIRWLVRSMERLEQVTNTALAGFDDIARSRGNHKYSGCWRVDRDRDNGVGPIGLQWVKVDLASKSRERVPQPTARLITRASTDECREIQLDSLRTARELTAAHKNLRPILAETFRSVAKLEQLLGLSDGERSQGETESRWTLAVSQVNRRSRALAAGHALRIASDELSAIDHALQPLLAAFNSVEPEVKPTAFRCTFEIRDRPAERWYGPRGPTFFFSARSGGHLRKFRINANKGAGPAKNNLTREILLSRNKNQHAAKYLYLYKQIEPLRRRRQDIGAQIELIAKTLRPVTRNKVTTLPE